MSIIAVSVDLRSLFGPVRNQGPRPTCMAFAASDAHAALRVGWVPLSCEYAFYHAQRRAGRPPSKGALLSSMLDALRQDGQPAESGWPYLAVTPVDEAAWAPPTDVGPLFGRNGERSSHVLDQVIRELDQGRPVIILLMLSRAFYNPTPEAVIESASGEAPERERRHAVIAVGHGTVDGQRAILARNSWGVRWGDLGHGWLTERFLGPRVFAAATLMEEVGVSAHSTAA
ncbi:MAG TPA: C1 family peptidase [Stellaceae bacterium]|nr:C1 family peptidase [Stellaceae bacterium]